MGRGRRGGEVVMGVLVWEWRGERKKLYQAERECE